RGRHRVLMLVDVIAMSGRHEAGAGRLTAPMPGKVIAVNTRAGARVNVGTPLLVMEAMKMEHTIVAPADGVVAELLYSAGDPVAEGREWGALGAEERGAARGAARRVLRPRRGGTALGQCTKRGTAAACGAGRRLDPAGGRRYFRRIRTGG